MTLRTPQRLLVAVVLLACVSEVVTASAQKPMTISGRVIGWKDLPIANATVVFAAGQREVLTDSLGRFSLTARVLPGCWRIYAAFIGYDRLSLYLPLVSGPQSIGDIRLQESYIGGHPVTERRCAGTEDTWTGGSYPIAHAILVGTVSDRLGQPVVGLSVGLSCEQAMVGRSVPTDSLGWYSLEVVVAHYHGQYSDPRTFGKQVLCETGPYSGLRQDSVVVKLRPWKKEPKRTLFDLSSLAYR